MNVHLNLPFTPFREMPRKSPENTRTDGDVQAVPGSPIPLVSGEITLSPAWFPTVYPREIPGFLIAAMPMFETMEKLGDMENPGTGTLS